MFYGKWRVAVKCDTIHVMIDTIIKAIYSLCKVYFDSQQSVDLVLEEVRRRLDFQFEQMDSYQFKASIVLGISGVILTTMFMVFSNDAVLIVLNLESMTIFGIIIKSYKIAWIPLFISILLAFIIIWVRKYDRPPSLDHLRKYYLNKNEDETKLKIIDICIEAFHKNERRLNIQATLLQIAYVFVLIGLGAFIYLFIKIAQI